MADFSFTPLIRDVDNTEAPQVANPRTLEIKVRGGRQIYPPRPGPAGSANRLLIFAGTIQFDQDGGIGEDPSNPPGEEGEVDEGEQRTVQLRLRDPEAQNDSLTAAAAIGSLGSVFLAGNHGGIDVLVDVFGVAVA